MTRTENDDPLTVLCVLYELSAIAYCERSEEKISLFSLQGKYSKYKHNYHVYRYNTFE